MIVIGDSVATVSEYQNIPIFMEKILPQVSHLWSTSSLKKKQTNEFVFDSKNATS